ncbi:hypothetical protein [Methylobacterium soli]|uniref:Uncharacterized protein n=1 Tax=Methylobacterium soli TaxID=553447 RepID=A0A6L3T0W9_9HYPH|nr:hypothetical protein [Methylobacterium soli]KAB1080150.1 hypothetical protein F6X53_07980 [Methylobacterium soli]GJE43953.1 hypothetical protein AEGHOMDF_3138 [Methylobacterium soli]
MYPSSETQAAATKSGRRQTDLGHDREHFRPVALPALAAAVRMKAPVAVKRETRIGERRGILEMLHEDAPLL